MSNHKHKSGEKCSDAGSQVSGLKKPQYEIRYRGGKPYEYNPETKLFRIPDTGKWKKNPRSSTRKNTAITKRYYSHPAVDPVIREITGGDDCKTQSIQYVLRIIALKQAKRRLQDKPEENKTYSWSHRELYSRILGPKYSDIMAKLVEKNILKTITHEANERQYPLYKFSNESLLIGGTLPLVTDLALNGKIENYYRWKAKRVSEDKLIIDYIVHNFSYINIDKKTFMETIWRPRYETKYLKKKHEKVSTLPEYMKLGEICWLIVDQWNHSDPQEKLECFSRCAFGHRLHHLFTHILSELRAYISDFTNNIYGSTFDMTEFDLSNSQPLIFANMLVEKHGLNPNEHEFIRLVQENRIYEDLASRLSTPERTVEREEAKTEMLHFLYSWAETSAQEKFEEFYGLPAELAKEYKTRENDMDGNRVPFNKRHTVLSQMMQRQESVIFGKIWARLIKEGYKFMPIHDGIYFPNLTTAQKASVQHLIEDEMGKIIKIKFKVCQEDVHKKPRLEDEIAPFAIMTTPANQGGIEVTIPTVDPKNEIIISGITSKEWSGMRTTSPHQPRKTIKSKN
jgi:hypothetical protein